MNKEDLGQVFTSKVIADYMSSLLTVPKNSSVLDPCFGGGVFLESLQNKGFCNITGCELDPFWYKTVFAANKQKSNRESTEV